MGGCCNKDASDRSNEVTIENLKTDRTNDINLETTMSEKSNESIHEEAPEPMLNTTADSASKEYPEKFGSTEFNYLFTFMQNNAKREIFVKESIWDPKGSAAAQFWTKEQIFAQATDEKLPTNSIDLTLIPVKEAPEKT